MRRIFLQASALAGLVGALVAGRPDRASATAAMTVLGNTDAQECYLAASMASAAVASLDSCRQALASGELATDDRAATLVNMGILLNQLGRTGEAIATFEKALALSPELPEAALSRGNSHFLRKDYDRAIADYERSLRWGIRDQAAAHFNRGLAHAKKRNYAEAARAFARALELRPDFARAQAHLDQLRSRGLVARETSGAGAKPAAYHDQR